MMRTHLLLLPVLWPLHAGAQAPPLQPSNTPPFTMAPAASSGPAQAAGCIQSAQMCRCFDTRGESVPLKPGLCTHFMQPGADPATGGNLERYEAQPIVIVPAEPLRPPLPEYGLGYALRAARAIAGSRLP